MGLFFVHTRPPANPTPKTTPQASPPAPSKGMLSQTRAMFLESRTYFTPSWNRSPLPKPESPPVSPKAPTKTWRQYVGAWGNSASQQLGQWQSGLSGYLSRKSGWTQLKQEVLDDLERSPQSLAGEESLAHRMLQRLLDSPEKLQQLYSDPEFQRLSRKLFQGEQEALERTLRSPVFQKAPPHEQIGLILGHLGGGPGKILQMLSSDPSLPEGIRETFGVLKSRNLASRDPAEAQAFVDRIYGPNRYRLGGVAGVGSIGEVYFATDQRTKQPVAIKLINKNVSRERMETLEKPLLNVIIRHLESDPQAQTHQIHQLDSLYREWVQEFDLAQEAKNAVDLGKSLKRCHVVQPLAQGRLPESPQVVSLVLERARGVRLDHLSRLLRLHQRSPALYQTAITPLCEEHPWLRTPERWKHKLPAKYRDINNEQAFLQIHRGAESVSHGDPHTANAFAWFHEAKNTMEFDLIDPGLVARRNSQEVAQHLGLMLNTLVTNSRGMAENLVDMADKRPNIPREELVKQIAEKLDCRLYQKRVNLMDFQYNNRLLNQILQESQIELPDKATIFFKSQAQAYLTYEELAHRAGQKGSHYLSGSIGDLFHSAALLLRHEPRAAIQYVTPALQHLCTGGRHALRNTLQFFFHRPPV